MKLIKLIVVGLLAGVAGYYFGKKGNNLDQTSTIGIHSCAPESSCCQDIEYCGISEEELIRYMRNYRDSVWSKTSEYFRKNDYESNKKILINGQAPEGEFEFDARFMDIPLDDLKNYMCRLYNSVDPRLKDVNTLRMYYIRYDDNLPTLENGSIDTTYYKGMHSLAIVPVMKIVNGGIPEEVKEIHETTDKDLSLFMHVSQCRSNSPYANHNQLCPPLNDCGDIRQTLIYQADNQ